MLKTQRQVVERQFIVQDAIEQELNTIDDRLRAGEWADCSPGERLRRSLRAKTEVLDRALERAEVKRSKRLYRYLKWERQSYAMTLANLREQSEAEKVEIIPPKKAEATVMSFTPATQEEIEAVLNPPEVPLLYRVNTWLNGRSLTRRFVEWLDSFNYASSPEDPEQLILAFEEEIPIAEERCRREKAWERLTETQKQVRILEKKILLCERTIAAGVHCKSPEVIRYALRAKECYTAYLDALKLDLPPS